MLPNQRTLASTSAGSPADFLHALSNNIPVLLIANHQAKAQSATPLGMQRADARRTEYKATINASSKVFVLSLDLLIRLSLVASEVKS